MQLPALIVVPLTRFTEDLDVDLPALRRQIDYVINDCQATMVVAAGVETQEYTYLGFEQRKILIRQTIDAVDQRVPVMVRISHASFKTSIELAHLSKTSAPRPCSCWRRCVLSRVRPLNPTCLLISKR
jgi:4-hydroxy-tetrahydrodipicolinate synthase